MPATLSDLLPYGPDVTNDLLLDRFLEYVADRGAHADVPVAEIMATFERAYPGLFDGGGRTPATRFRQEAGEAEPESEATAG